GDGHRDAQVRAVGTPHGVLLDIECQQQVTGAARTGAALAAQADLLPVVHAGGDAGGDRAAVHGQADLGALRGVAEADPGAGGDVGALGGRAGAAAALEAAGLAAPPAEQLQQVIDIGAARAPARGRAGTRMTTAAEHRGEDVLEAGAAGAALAGGEARAARAHGPDRVVLLALLVIVEDRVGLTDLLELLLGLRIIGVMIGVVLARLGAVGLLDLLRARVLGDTEDRVEV